MQRDAEFGWIVAYKSLTTVTQTLTFYHQAACLAEQVAQSMRVLPNTRHRLISLMDGGLWWSRVEKNRRLGF